MTGYFSQIYVVAGWSARFVEDSTRRTKGGLGSGTGSGRGKESFYVSEAEASDYVAGFVYTTTTRTQFSIRTRRPVGQGKSADTFAPLGPFLVTRDELPNFASLAMWLKVNGEFRQRSSTAAMIFGVPFLVSYISQFMTLLPGDVISTGTPAGVAMGMKPPQYLKPGDVVELGVDGLGESRQTVVA
jgi:2-keto-4-pentenoate hydratase/2-oxohepta-3-ene-1,7-dioic acid hydratase in catechol pathway